MTFGESISTCFSKFFVFRGRASRSEFWWFYLFCMIINWASYLADPFGLLGFGLSIAFFFPSLSAAVRRLHDTNHSGWWLFLSFTIIVLINSLGYQDVKVLF